MFNRTNKITSLLLAAAAVASFVPATGANAATRLSTKEGTIEDAVAFNGKYIYKGYKSDDVDKAVWYNNGEKDVELEEYDEENYDFTTTTYGEKYILAKDGNDEYLVDLNSGKVLDETLEDKLDNSASALEKAIKKTDKFENQQVNAEDLNEITPDYAKFKDAWYYADIENADGQKVRVLTNESGKYITTDKLANVYVYSKEKEKVVKINKFKDADENPDKDTGLKVELADLPEVIAQDKDYLYAITKVKITDYTGMSDSELKSAKEAAKAKLEAAIKERDKYNNIATTEKETYDNAVKAQTEKQTAYDDAVAAQTEKQTAYDNAVAALAADPTNADKQKAVTDTKTELEAAKTAATNANTELEDAKTAVEKADKAYTDAMGGFAEDKKAAEAAVAKAQEEVDKLNADGAGSTSTDYAYYLQKISKAQGDKDDDAYMPKSVDSYLIDNKKLYDNGDCKDAYDWLIENNNELVNVQVEGGNSLYVYRVDNSNDTKVKVLKLDLKKMKEKSNDEAIKAAIGSDTKLDGYAVKKDGDTDRDCEARAWSVDANGVLWLLDDGKIVKFDKKEKTEVYSCDSGLDKLDVYDENNLVAWNEEDERYTTVIEGKKQTLDDAAAIDPDANKPAEVKTGWQQDATTKAWTLLGADGAVLTGWQNVGGVWYYLDPANNGIMATGWKQINGTWYLLDNSGAMLTGWQNVGGTWYYLEPVNSNGAMKTGWFQDTTGTWYYADGSGAMLSNTVVDGYVLGANGAWVK